MTDTNWNARNRAIARDLMGWTKIEPTVYDEGKKLFYGGIPPGHFTGYPIPAYHKNPVAADKVLEKLKPIGYSSGYDPDVKEAWFHAGDNGAGDPICEGDADTWMQALVLCVTQEGKFCLKCHNEPKIENECFHCECGLHGHEKALVTARVRPELKGEINGNS